MIKNKIAIISYDFYPITGGIGKNLKELYLKLITKNINIVALSPCVNNLKNHNTVFRITKNLPLGQILFTLFINIFIKKLIKKYEITLLILPSGPGGVLLLRKLNIPVIYIANHTYSQQVTHIKSEFWKWVFIPFEKKSLLNANEIVAISNSTKDDLVSNYNITPNRILVITPFIDVAEELSSTIRDNKQILFVGRLDKRKGLDFLINAIGELKKINSNFKLIVVGDGKLKNKYIEQSRKLNLGGHISFLGKVKDDELIKLYQTSIIQVVPSRFEGFGIVAIEAMSKGLVVIATNTAGLKDIIKPDENGFLVEFADITTLSKLLDKLLINQDLCKTLGERARNYVSEFFNTESALTKYIKILEKYE